MSESNKAQASEAEAREVAESAREDEWAHPSFVRDVFLGRFNINLIHPHPEQDLAEEERAAQFLTTLREFMESIDSTEIDRTGEVPEGIVQKLRDIGAFGIKIPREYGGLGFSQLTYVRAISIVSTSDGSLTALLSAAQSIGVPQPLKLFGTEEQKKRFLPRLASGAISAFALTETDAGSDPANLRTTATLSEDGSHYILNGEKLWCTNGTRAELLVVMARTPDAIVNGKPRKQITAFIVEANSPGVKVQQRLHFMGLKAIENGLLSFENVRVPKENILWGEGKGLKLALTTLNTGRLTLPASCAGVAKAMLRIVREWSNERVQWGQPIGKHEAVAQMISRIAVDTFAMESIAELSSLLADRGGYDIRLEAAVAKLYNTEAGWRIVDNTMQIRGGRGYEMESSLTSRGEKAYPVERAMRDFRINLIFEGSSEIMRLFIAREAVDHHFKLAFDIVRPHATLGERWRALRRSAPFYLSWYPSRWLNPRMLRRYGEFGELARHVRFAERATRRLGRAVFHCMLRYGPALEKRQMVLFRAVDIGAELFAMSAACVRATWLAKKGEESAIHLADLFCKEARVRIGRSFRSIHDPLDKQRYETSAEVLRGEHQWLEQGIAWPGYSSRRLSPDSALPNPK